MRHSLSADDIAYADASGETSSEYAQKMLKEYGIDNPFVNKQLDNIKDIKKGENLDNIDKKD